MCLYSGCVLHSASIGNGAEMITLSYVDESGKHIQYTVSDWDAVYRVAHSLVNAPIDLDYLEYLDGDHVGTFNLNNFEKC